MGYLVFQAIGNILNLKQKQWNTKVKVKEIDLIWSQTCSSLLHVLTDWQVISPETPSTVVEFVHSSGLPVLFFVVVVFLYKTLEASSIGLIIMSLSFGYSC